MRLRVGVLLVLVLVPLPGYAEAPFAGRRAVLPGRLVVKYRAAVDACVHCLLARGIPLARLTGRRSLDDLHHQMGVRGARPLFFQHHTVHGGRTAAWASRSAGRGARLGARSSRAGTAAAPDLSRVYVLDLPLDADVAAAAARYAADPDVEYAEPEREAHTTLVPNDPFFATSGSWGQPYRDLWGLGITGAATAWDTAIGAGAVVAVVDTGIDETHPDLAGNLWTNPGEIPGNGLDDDGNGYADDIHGWDFVDHDASPHDLNGHGTHCAGTVAATGNNGLGVVGMAWGARVMGVRGLAATGAGGDAGLAEGLVYAAENGADVISNSWGGYGISQVLVDAVETARSLGSVVVAAAGNGASPVDDFSPAGIPGVIAVGATDASDEIASFSNFGEALSVSAPGVDVLSLRAGVVDPRGAGVVGTNYLRLSGTSMATPHVSGLAAVLLSSQPGLTIDEVRWHLELNGDQHGYPGYEGQPWNPYFGWGRINAARVFDTPPVTTRVRPRALEVHGYAGGVTPDVASLDLEFSTLVPVGWTLAAPSWLLPSATGGAGSMRVTFALDATAVPSGTAAGTVVVAAPAAVDGGAAVPVAAGVHRDERVGEESVVAGGAGAIFEMRVASDGLSTLVVWLTTENRIGAARLDASGTASAAVELTPGPYPLPGPGVPARHGLDVATNGRDFLVTWIESSGVEFVQALPVGPDGQPFPGRAAVLHNQRRKGGRFLRNTRVAFDGATYLVLWDQYDFERQRSKISFARVGGDRTLRSRRRKLYPGYGSEAGAIMPRLACGNGSCLIAWKEGVATLSSIGKSVPAYAWALPVIGDRVAGPARRLFTDVDDLAEVRSDGSGYVLLGWRQSICPGPFVCGEQVVAVRADAAGTAVEEGGTRLDVGPAMGTPSAFPTGLAHDGTDWLATFVSSGRIFGARMAADGTRLDSELIGLLLSPVTTASSAAIVATRTDALIVWKDGRFPHPTAGGVGLVAQRVLAHAAAPALDEIPIGSIGPHTGDEGAMLGFTVSAPTLGPSPVYSASGLPPGAVFDVPTRTFRWVPAADQAGMRPSVRFEATDGVGTVSEDVTLAVTEAVRSVSGTVRLVGGAPAPFIAVRLAGAPGAKRMVLTDAAGRYRFDDLAPRTYTVKLAASSSDNYVAMPPSTRVLVAETDVAGVDLVVAPR